MGLKACWKWSTRLGLLGAALVIIGEGAGTWPLAVAGLAVIVAAAVISIRFWRCPGCGRWLGRGWSIPEYCPQCGRALWGEEDK